MKPLTIFALIAVVLAMLVVGLWVLPSRNLGAAPAAQTGVGGVDHSRMDHSGVGTAAMDHSAMGHGSAQDMAMMDQLGGLRGPDFDRAFLSAMIPHHRAAVEMSRAVLETTQDPQVRAWAGAIIEAQDREIAQMNRMLQPLGGPDAGMAGHMEGMMADMVSATRTGGDRAFVEGMLPHHASAITMATMALLHSDNPEVLDLAREIAQEQAREMRELRQWTPS